MVCGKVGVEISHIHCTNQGVQIQQRARQEVEMVISLQTLFICICVCVFACPIRSLVPLRFNGVHVQKRATKHLETFVGSSSSRNFSAERSNNEIHHQ